MCQTRPILRVSLWTISARESLDQFFAVTAPGVAPYTAQELRRLGLLPPEAKGRRSERSGGQRSGQPRGGKQAGGASRETVRGGWSGHWRQACGVS
mgnify:CR=1 FL=1